MSTTRRELLQWAGLAALAGCGAARQTVTVPSPPQTLRGMIPRRYLGSTGIKVSILGMGGAHLGRVGSAKEVARMVDEALAAGLDFFDNAWEYGDGRSEAWLGEALRGKRAQAFLMTKVCTHGRDRTIAMQQLESSLRRLRTDYLDLWQIHECIYDDDPTLAFARDGVVRALEEAKRQGKTRFVGFTGHKHPRIHQRMLSGPFRFDTVEMPINVFDATFRSFEREILPLALGASMGVIGMKSLGGQGAAIARGGLTVEQALAYAMSVPGVSVTVSGMDSLAVLRRNVELASAFVPMPLAEMADLRARCARWADDGRFEPYKTTTRFDAALGRAFHAPLGPASPRASERPTAAPLPTPLPDGAGARGYLDSARRRGVKG